MFSKKKLILALENSLKTLAVLSVVSSTAAYAANATFEQDLGSITVTDSAEVSPVLPVTDATGMQHNTVSTQQIKNQGALDVGSALKNVPGVIHQHGTIIGNQQGANVYIRGRGASHPSADLNIMFDGVPRMGALYGQSFFEGVALGSIGSINIYKNPQPGVFGSGYAAIDMTPRVMSNDGFEAEVNLAGGSHGTYQEGVSMGYKYGAFDAYLAQDWTSTDGHREHSRAQQGNLYMNLGWAFNDNWNLRFLVNRTEGQTQDPLGVANGLRYDILTTFTTLTLNNKYDNADGFVKVYWNDTDYDIVNENGPGTYSRQDVKLYGVRAKESFTLWDGGQIVAGFDLDKTDLKNKQDNSGVVTHWDFPNTTLFSPYMTMSQTFGDADFSITPSVGFRAYEHSEFADKFGAQAGVVVKSGDLSVHANYARGVNYPSPVVQQGVLGNTNYKWSDMKPEVVDHYEIGVEYQINHAGKVSATAYYDEGKDRFTVYMAGAGISLNDPIGKYKVRGIELATQWTFANGSDAFASVSYIDAESTVREGMMGQKYVTYNHLPYTPEWQIQLGGTWKIDDKWKLYGDVMYLSGLYSGQSMRVDGVQAGWKPSQAPVKQDDICLANIRLSRAISYPAANIVGGEVYLAVNNLFDADYQWADGYPMPGVTAMVGLNLRF